MIQVEVSIVDGYLIEAYRQLVEREPELLRSIVGKVVNLRGDELLTAVRKAPGPVKYPIRWASQRQRRAYFATRGFGHGIPYRRTGRLADGYRLKVVYEPDAPAAVYLTSDVPYERYVKGEDQQPFHVITGWENRDDQAAHFATRMADEVETELIKAFYIVEGR